MVPKIASTVYIFAVIAGLSMVPDVEANCSLVPDRPYYQSIGHSFIEFWADSGCNHIRLYVESDYIWGEVKGISIVN